MRRGAKITAVALAAFVAVLIARLPARWAAGALPRGAACARISGTLWSGACAGLTELGAPIGDLTWELHPLRLLTASLSADVALSRGEGTARARIDIGPSGTVTARGVQASFPLDRALLPALPPGMQGSAQADIPFLRCRGLRLLGIRGRIDVRGLTDGRGEPLGSYRLSFPASSAPGASTPGAGSGGPVGRLTDLGGPFSVDGTVRLTSEPGYVVEAEVAARPGAPPDLANAVRYLGSPDPSGRRPLTLSGTF
jgi:hypothetical protein